MSAHDTGRASTETSEGRRRTPAEEARTLVSSMTVGYLATVGEDGALRPQACRQGQGVGGAVDCHHPGACRNADLHRAQTHAADPDHRDPLVAPYARSGIQRPVGGSEPAAQCGRRGILNDIGDCDQVGVRTMQGHIFGE